MFVKSKLALLRYLLYLREVVIYGSITAASEKNGIKPSNLSRDLKTLEHEFSSRLFIRQPHGLTPTDEAKRLAAEVAEIDRILEKISSMILPTDKHEVIRVFLPENSDIQGWSEFVELSGMQICFVASHEEADLIVDYRKPKRADELVSVENQTGKLLKQKIWVCAENRPAVLKVAHFIIDRIHSQ